MPPPSPRSRTGALFPHMPFSGSAFQPCSELRSFLAARWQGRFPLTPRARATRHDRQPATGRLAAPPAALSPRTPFPASPPVIARIRGTGLEKPAFPQGRFFCGGSGVRILFAADTLRASAADTGPLAAAGYARHPEPAGAARRVSHAPPISCRHACAVSPARGSTRRRRRPGCRTNAPRARRTAAASQPHRDRYRLPHGVTG